MFIFCTNIFDTEKSNIIFIYGAVIMYSAHDRCAIPFIVVLHLIVSKLLESEGNGRTGWGYLRLGEKGNDFSSHNFSYCYFMDTNESPEFVSEQRYLDRGRR